MAKIIRNASYVETGDTKKTGLYLFDAEDGSALTPLVVWLEKSKANDKHPDGKPWIKLPKGNVTNREYFSEDLFIATAVNDEVVVDVKTTAPRVLGASGVKQDIIKYLSEEEAQEYTELVNNAVDKYKASKSQGKKKPAEMTIDELEAYLENLKAIQSGQSPAVSGPKSFIDCMTDEQYTRYNQLLAISAENKANAPKATRKPLTDEEKASRKAKRIDKEISSAEALLASLRAEAANRGM